LVSFPSVSFLRKKQKRKIFNNRLIPFLFAVSLSTYFGGNSEDIVNGLDTTSTLTLSVGSTKSTNLPLGGTPISSALKGAQDGFISTRTNGAGMIEFISLLMVDL
jgi:hypothetical protein